MYRRALRQVGKYYKMGRHVFIIILLSYTRLHIHFLPYGRTFPMFVLPSPSDLFSASLLSFFVYFSSFLDQSRHFYDGCIWGTIPLRGSRTVGSSYQRRSFGGEYEQYIVQSKRSRVLWIYWDYDPVRGVEFIPSPSHLSTHLATVRQLHPHVATIYSTQHLPFGDAFHSTLQFSHYAAIRTTFRRTIGRTNDAGMMMYPCNVLSQNILITKPSLILAIYLSHICFSPFVILVISLYLHRRL